MKKRTLLFIYFLFLSIFFVHGNTTIRLSHPFRLNPILGINGDDFEASSKFVQRMIYSPLVFPLQDPYLQDDFEISFDLSLIESLEYSRDAVNWTAVDLRNNRVLAGGDNTLFRIKLRERLNFYREGSNRPYDSLTKQDVVYSYRISRITMDRAYQNYISGKSNTLGLNTLLYSKIKSFNDVYCTNDTTQYVYFRMDSNKTFDQFLKLLVYVPVLSSKQINDENMKRDRNSPIFRSIHNELNMANLLATDTISRSEYDVYDIKKLLLDKNGKYNPRGEDFFNRPIGYGQFLILGRIIQAGGGGRDIDLWEYITLVRNPEWCNFPGNSRKNIGGKIFNHDVYRRKNDRFIVRHSNDMGTLQDQDVLYNFPLSASMFGDMSLGLVSEQRNKLKMQISHNLFGIFFGPAIHNTSLPMYKEVRDFFSCFADRIRIENRLKYMRPNTQFDSFDSEILLRGSILEDLSMQKLYYPFYTGGQPDDAGRRSGISGLYDRLEDEDELYQQYKELLDGRSLQDFYRNLNSIRDRQEFYQDFVGGVEFPGSIQNKMDFAFQNARNYILWRNGEIHIEIIYKNGDVIGQTIAFHYRNTLSDYFLRKGIKHSIEPVGIDDYSLWRTRAVNNARSQTMSLLVKGWNYKFDLLDELKGQFVDAHALDAIERHYEQMINDSRLSAETVFYRIAQEFVNNTVMIPMIGIQNYAVYNKGSFPAFDNHSDIEILLLPYYWD